MESYLTLVKLTVIAKNEDRLMHPQKAGTVHRGFRTGGQWSKKE